jgi:hypothetical protein
LRFDLGQLIPGTPTKRAKKVLSGVVRATAPRRSEARSLDDSEFELAGNREGAVSLTMPVGLTAPIGPARLSSAVND